MSSKGKGGDKLADFVAKDAKQVRRELVERLRKENPKITQSEIDRELGLVEATIGF